MIIKVLEWTCGPFKELEKYLTEHMPVIELLGLDQVKQRNADWPISLNVADTLRQLKKDGYENPIAIPSYGVIEPPPTYGGKTIEQWREYLRIGSYDDKGTLLCWYGPYTDKLEELVEAVETQTLKDSKGPPLLNVASWRAIADKLRPQLKNIEHIDARLDIPAADQNWGYSWERTQTILEGWMDSIRAEEKARIGKAIEALKIPANPGVIDTRTIHWNSAVDAALRELGLTVSEPTKCNICNNPECDTPNGKH